ncbi:MAG: glycosyltransferase family 2 protein [Flavobacteriaceae bacterium]|nr:glycosyltransferase family 2 protein [Flavobacteriaceae bacterium]
MKFALIICTYNRPKSIDRLLKSVEDQNLLPDEVVVVDGSEQENKALQRYKFEGILRYDHISASQRGLTRQRNYGLSIVSPEMDIICFLDDDVILERNYFEELIKTFRQDQNTIGVGGYITNEVKWMRNSSEKKGLISGRFYFDGFYRELPLRFKLRKALGLMPDVFPGKMPKFGHGLSVSFLPPSGKVYSVEMLMGGVAAYKKPLFDKIQFSEFFQGYGLYEDADFSLRAAQLGKLYINTNAQLEHHHEPAGRPNMFKYGRMVVRNGYYVWRIKNPKPNLKDRFKWHTITLLLLVVRATNVITGPKRKQALMETIGRKIGYFELWIRPQVPKNKTA